MASPCLIIAEAGVNHNGSLKLALELVDIAVAAKADIVKFQTFTTEKVMSKVARKAKYQGETNESQLELVKKLELIEADFREIAAYCKQRGIEFLSTGFDSDSISFLESLNPRLYKIPSGEITHDALIKQVASYGKPIILSTGMAEMDEIERALSWIGPQAPVTLLQCVSAYPAAHSDLNLRAMATMAERFKLPVGLSDHSLGISASVAAVALGATVIEKHFTLDRNLPGPDHQASLDPTQLIDLVKSIREVESAMGDGLKRRMPNEEDVAAVARRSLVAMRNLPKGHVLAKEDATAKRPGTGIPPYELEQAIGRTLTRDIGEDELILWEDLG